MHFKCKEIAFKTASEEYEVKEIIAKCEEKLQEISENMDQKLQILKRRTEQCKTEELRSQDLKNSYA